MTVTVKLMLLRLELRDMKLMLLRLELRDVVNREIWDVLLLMSHEDYVHATIRCSATKRKNHQRLNADHCRA